MVRSKSEFVEETMDVNYSLDIFEMAAITSEPSKIIVKRELLIFNHYQMNVKETTCPFKWWEKHEIMFPIVGFHVQQILRIVGSQIETEFFSSLAMILTNLRRYHLKPKFLEKLIFTMNRN
jgi:hypothetical protein